MRQRKERNEVLEKLTSIEALLRKKNDKPLNFNQAADYLGFSHSYLYKLTSRKIIPCHRPTGKMLFFSKEELDEWIVTSEKEKDKSQKVETQDAETEDEEPP
ncbi:MAG: helix-turn-helix domain-containing protein [Melioribacteraceae bacterium]|nr:MAG: helix-turn-helix domain-containing protein [Melioribacteraceae bacterium]